VVETPANPSSAYPMGSSSGFTVRLAAVAWVPPYTVLEKMHGSALTATPWQCSRLPTLCSRKEGLGCRLHAVGSVTAG